MDHPRPVEHVMDALVPSADGETLWRCTCGQVAHIDGGVLDAVNDWHLHTLDQEGML